MLDLLKANPTQILAFALVLSRVTAFLFASSLFSIANISMPLRILLSLLLSFLIFPMVSAAQSWLQWSDFEFLGLCLGEVLKGLGLGFLTRLFFFVCSSFGEFLSLTMGLNSSQLYNPMLGTQGSSLEQFVTVLGTLFFLCLGGHHYLIKYLVHSYSTWNIGGPASVLKNFGAMAESFGEVLWLAVKLTAPVMVSLLLVNVAMGVLGKAVPQLNVLISSFPVTILVGFFVLLVTFPLIFVEWNQIFEWTVEQSFQALKAGK